MGLDVCLTVTPKGRMLSRNPSVERTFSLPSNPTTSGSFLLPSYPLATLPGGMLTPTLSRRHVDSSLSMSNTWPNKRENSPHQQDTIPWSDPAGTAKGNLGKIEEVDMTAECKNVLFVSSWFFLFSLFSSIRRPFLQQMLSAASSCLPHEFFFHFIIPPGSEQHQDNPIYITGCPYSRAVPVS